MNNQVFQASEPRKFQYDSNNNIPKNGVTDFNNNFQNSSFREGQNVQNSSFREGQNAQNSSFQNQNLSINTRANQQPICSKLPKSGSKISKSNLKNPK